MNRRKALKNLGATIGITTLPPTILSIFESCQKNNSNKLLSFNNEQFEFVSSIIDIIIPRTDTPGAIDLNLNKFIDMYIEEVLYKKEKENFLKGLDICKKNIQTVDDKSLKGLLDKYLKIDDNLADKYDNMISDFEDDLKNGRNSVWNSKG